MRAVAKGLKAIYNFFSGDLVLLTATLVAFLAVGLLARFSGASNILLVIVFILAIACGLAVSLARERPGRK